MDKQDEALKLLKDIRHINKQIDLLIDDIEVAYTRLTSTTVKPKDMNIQTSLPADPMADKIIELVEHQRQLDSYQRNLLDKREIFFMILEKTHAESQVYLTLRYLQGKSVEDIGNEQGYGYRRAWDKLHDAEVDFIENYLKFA